MVSRRKQETTQAITVCSKCFAAYKGTQEACPYCGVVKAIEAPEIEVDNSARLVEVSKDEIRERRRQAREAWASATNWRQLFLVAERFGLPKKDVFFEGKRRGYAMKRKSAA